jgi:hypothetical protein
MTAGKSRLNKLAIIKKFVVDLRNTFILTFVLYTSKNLHLFLLFNNTFNSSLFLQTPLGGLTYSFLITLGFYGSRIG